MNPGLNVALSAARWLGTKEGSREHREILEAITEQDASAARDLMHRHLKRRFRLLTEE